MNENQVPKEWEAGNEKEMLHGLEVIYEMASGYILRELFESDPEVYNRIKSHKRQKVIFSNRLRFAVDEMLSDVLAHYQQPDSAAESD